jgi:hypothetical protein
MNFISRIIIKLTTRERIIKAAKQEDTRRKKGAAKETQRLEDDKWAAYR